MNSSRRCWDGKVTDCRVCFPHLSSLDQKPEEVLEATKNTAGG